MADSTTVLLRPYCRTLSKLLCAEDSASCSIAGLLLFYMLRRRSMSGLMFFSELFFVKVSGYEGCCGSITGGCLSSCLEEIGGVCGGVREAVGGLLPAALGSILLLIFMR
jgi:hypothetical protein